MDSPYFVRIPLQADSTNPTPFDVVRAVEEEATAVYLGPFASEDAAVHLACKAARSIGDSFANSDLDWRTAVRAVVGMEYSDVLVSGQP